MERKKLTPIPKRQPLPSLTKEEFPESQGEKSNPEFPGQIIQSQLLSTDQPGLMKLHRAQRQAWAHHLGHLGGNQNFIRQAKIVQREDGEEENTAQNQEQGDVTFTEEEAGDVSGQAGLPSTEDIESNMQSDFQVTEGTQEILYINMPQMIAGMGYTRDRMQGIFQAVSRGRDRIVLPAYTAWQESPADERLRTQLNESITRFEAEVGAGVRGGIRDYWSPKRVSGSETITPVANTLNEITTQLTGERDTILGAPATGETTTQAPTSIEIEDLRGFQSRLAALRGRITGDLTRTVNGLNLTGLDRGLKNQLKSSLTNCGNKIRNLSQAARGSLSRRQLTTFRSRMESAIQELQSATARFRQVVTNVDVHNRRVTTMMTRIMDVNAVPILIPRTRGTATVVFGGQRTTYRTHHESRMAYYEEGYQATSVSPPGRTISEVQPAAADRPAGARERRMYDVFHRLRDLNVALSEAKILAAIAGGEGSFASTQTVDRVRFSWGIIQFQGAALMSLLQQIRTLNPSIFSAYFEAYGITIRQRGQGPTPVERNTRPVPGSGGGVPTSEARGVNNLMVYDHQNHVWVNGNEALFVIQRDPRYQALFIAAAQEIDVQTAQMMAAREGFINSVRTTSLRLGSGDAQQNLRVNQFVNNEVAMFGLVERKVATGNIGFATRMVNGFITGRHITPANLASASQPDLASWIRSYPGLSIRWQLADGLPSANLPAMRNDAYEGGV